jgi:hypothetical protein
MQEARKKKNEESVTEGQAANNGKLTNTSDSCLERESKKGYYLYLMAGVHSKKYATNRNSEGRDQRQYTNPKMLLDRRVRTLAFRGLNDTNLKISPFPRIPL